MKYTEPRHRARKTAALVASGRQWYDAGKEAVMIELTEQQMQALENPDVTPPRIINPRTGETFVLLRAEEYERLKEEEYDDSPWTREELEALAWEAAERTGWEE
jgi:PHD/YefM family antitoxin component YafN of YafNO toxin-antitoxin module